MSLRICFEGSLDFFGGQPSADNLQSTEIRSERGQMREEVIYSESPGTAFSVVSYRTAV